MHSQMIIALTRGLKMTVVQLTILAVAGAQPLLAQTEAEQEAFSFINQNTLAVVRVDVSKLELPDPSDGTDDQTSSHRIGLKAMQKRIDAIASLTGDSPLYIKLDLPTNPTQLPLSVFVIDRSGLNTAALQEQLGFETEPTKLGDFWQYSPAPSPALQPAKLSPNGTAAAAFVQASKLTDKETIQVLVVPPQHVYRTYNELLSELPASLGGGPLSLITDGLRVAALAMDTQNGNVSIHIQAASPEAASALAERLPDMVEAILSQLLPTSGMANEKAAALASQIVEQVKVTVQKDRISALYEASQNGDSANLLAYVVKEISGPISRQAKMKRFKQIGLAIHNYSSANAALPPKEELRNENGRSGLSWRVHILPFLEEAELYSRFKLDERWDSPHNMKLLKEMPEVYSSFASDWALPANVQPGYTCIQAPLSDNTIFGSPEEVTIGKITDGTSNTLFTVETAVDSAVPWTSPQDYRFDEAKPGAGLAKAAGGFVAGMADGSVHFLPNDLPAETLLRLFEMNDGEVVQW